MYDLIMVREVVWSLLNLVLQCGWGSDCWLLCQDLVFLVGFVSVAVHRSGQRGFIVNAVCYALLRALGVCRSLGPFVILVWYLGVINFHLIRFYTPQPVAPDVPMYLITLKGKPGSFLRRWIKGIELEILQHWALYIPFEQRHYILHYRYPTDLEKKQVKRIKGVDPSSGLWAAVDEMPLDKLRKRYTIGGNMSGFSLRASLGFFRCLGSVPTEELIQWIGESQHRIRTQRKMDLSGKCHDWIFKIAYYLSTDRTLTYCMLLTRMRWQYGFALLALVWDFDNVHWQLANCHFTRAYLVIFSTILYDYYEMCSPQVRQSEMDRHGVIPVKVLIGCQVAGFCTFALFYWGLGHWLLAMRCQFFYELSNFCIFWLLNCITIASLKKSG